VTNDPTRPAISCHKSAPSLQPLSAAATDLESVVRSLQAELIACQRLAAMGSMMAMITHEFNNLLTPLMVRAEAALMGEPDIAFMRKALERTLVQSQRALAVAQHLLDMAHDRPRPTQACGVANAVREALETMTRPFEKDGINVRVAVAENLQVCARQDLLCQVLMNLLLNARQAMKGVQGALSIRAAECDGHVEIEICDGGKGIPADVLNQVVNPFLAADPQARPNDWQQVGLGLSACRLIAHDFGATIQAFANEGRGCTFRVRWPTSRPTCGSVRGQC
jgi:C4-dicarboxylate-specific signal transduction histidine kinase